MNYNYLRYFSVLAQVEHYTLAAARLGISQPSLSSAINHLEDELGGVKLFEKVGRNVRLTEEGRFYREKVDLALSELQSASMTLRESKVSAPVLIRIGIVSGTLEGLVAQQIVDYAKQNTRIRFQITESASQELMDMVRQEKLDMAIVDTTNRDRSLHFRKLCQRDFLAAVPENHPFRALEQLMPQQVAAQPQVAFNYNIENRFEQLASTEERIICTVNTAQSALDLVAAGVGISVIPGDSVQSRPGVRFIPIHNWHQALYMCILYDKWLEPPIWRFVDSLVATMRKHSQEV